MAKRFIRKSELKERFSQILRDPATTTEVWIQAYTKAEKLFRWKRRERKPRTEIDVSDLVRRIEAQKKFVQETEGEPKQ